MASRKWSEMTQVTRGVSVLGPKGLLRLVASAEVVLRGSV
jgi:hypothetical protein